MDFLLERDPELFERYALQDTEVTAVYFLTFIKTFSSTVPKHGNAWPSTVASVAQSIVRERWGYERNG